MIETPAEAGFRSLGQATARRLARRAVASGGTGTLLVHGPRGAGKDSFVDDLLALTFCTDADPELRPCNACRGCRDARTRSHPDLVVGAPATWREMRSTGESIVAAARRWLLEAASAPVVAPRRIVLIEHADHANEQTQNALLKTLEEPTDRHLFVLVADEPSRLLPTIRSRCQPLRVGPVPREELVRHLMDVERLPEDLAGALATIAGGLSGTATKYARERELLTWRRRVQSELLSLLERGRADRFGAVRDLLDETARLGTAAGADNVEEESGARTPASVQREAALALVDAWLSLSRDLLVAAAGRESLAPGMELGADLGERARRIGTGPMLAMIQRLEAVHDGLRENAAPRLALEAAVLAWPMLPRRDS